MFSGLEIFMLSKIRAWWCALISCLRCSTHCVQINSTQLKIKWNRVMFKRKQLTYTQNPTKRRKKITNGKFMKLARRVRDGATTRSVSTIDACEIIPGLLITWFIYNQTNFIALALNIFSRNLIRGECKLILFVKLLSKSLGRRMIQLFVASQESSLAADARRIFGECVTELINA